MNRGLLALVVSLIAIGAAVFFLKPGSSKSTAAGAGNLSNPAAADWPMFRRTYDSWGYSPLDQINKTNVSDLQFEWSVPVAPGRLESAPIVQDGVMYVAQPNDIVQAINAKTGDLIWQYRRELPDDVDEVQFPVEPAARNLAIFGGKVFATTSDAYVIALEAKTGKLAWETQVGDYLQTTHAAGPIVVKDKVITGRICKSGPCYIVAQDANTGTEVWRTQLADDGSWGNTPTDQRSTAGAWMVASYDPELDLLYMGTSYALSPTTGNALYTNSTLAIKPDSGEIAWHFQHLPKDRWGFDHVFERLILSTEVSPDASAVKWINPQIKAGETRKVISGVPGKTGLVYTLDAKTGEFLWARETVPQNIIANLNPQTGEPTFNPAAQPKDGSTVQVCPSRLGGKSWTASAYSPSTKALYVSVYDTCMAFREVGNYQNQTAPNTKLGHLEAISVSTGKTLWKYTQDAPLGSVLTTAGGLVVVGDFNRRMHVLDQESGKVLFETVLAGPITGYPISYSVEGKQYLAVTGGGGTELEKLSELLPNYKPLPGVNSVYVFDIPSK